MAGGQNPDYKVQLVDAVLFARKAVLSPTVQMAHIKALEKGTTKYPIRLVDCKVYSIPQSAMSHTHENLFLGTLPKRLILWCIDNDAYNGEFSKNPFNAKNNAIKGRLKHANKWIAYESIRILQYIAPIRYIRNVTVLF